MDIKTIEKSCEELEAKRTTVRERIQRMREEIAEVRARHMPGVREAVAAARTGRERLQVDVEASPELFGRPKTRTFHNIRVGYKKRPGRISWKNAAKVVEGIKKQLPDKAQALLRTKEEPVKAALGQLPATELKRLGVQVTHDQDVAVVEPTGDAVDKAVDGLIQTDDDIEEAA